MMASLNFHVRHEVTPERAWGVLHAIARGVDYEHITQYDRQLSRLRQLDLVTSHGEIQPTEHGQELHRIGTRRLELVWELLHFLHVTRWRAAHPTENTMFFTYQAYCDALYNKGNANLAEQREALTAEINNCISTSEYFAGEMNKLAKGAVSLSVNSLSGVEHWLEKLTPPVIRDGNFALRHYCPPELLVMAMGYVTEITKAELGIEQLLTEDRRENVCRICLLDKGALDQVLDWMFPEYPDLIQAGTHTGSYGRFVRVMQQPALKDLLR